MYIYMSDNNYEQKYLKYKKKYMELKKIQQNGGVRYCDTNDPDIQYLVNLWKIVRQNMKYKDYNFSGTIGRLRSSRRYPCNLWIWHKNNQTNYNHGNGPSNHVDLYCTNIWDDRIDFGITVSVNGTHMDTYNTYYDVLGYIDDEIKDIAAYLSNWIDEIYHDHFNT